MNKAIFFANLSIFFACLVIFFGNTETEERVEYDKAVENIKSVHEQLQEFKQNGYKDSDIEVKVGEAIHADLNRKKTDVIQVVELVQRPLPENDYNEIDLTPREVF